MLQPIARASGSRTLPIALSSLSSSAAGRGFATTAAVHAGGKAKPGKAAPALKKKAGSSFAKKARAAPAAGGGGGSSNITLRYSDARQPADTSDWLPLHPLSDHHSPACVIRQSTVDFAKRLDSIKAGSKPSGQTLLTGERGSGKSTLLFQAVTHALDDGWIVLYAPRASEWINSSSSYIYHPPSSTFHQPALSSTLLTHLLTVNAPRLAKLKTRHTHQIGGTEVRAGTDLGSLVKRGTGTDAAGVAVEVLKAVMAEVAAQDTTPVLIAIDEVQALFSRSAYLTPQSTPIESYNLSVPLLFLQYLLASSSSASSASSASPGGSAAPSPLKRGTFLTSLSYSTPSLPPSLTLRHALGLPTLVPVTPYTRLERGHLEHASQLRGGVMPVERMTPAEMAGMFEIYARKGWGANTDESYVSAMISSGGNPLELSRSLGRSLMALA